METISRVLYRKKSLMKTRNLGEKITFILKDWAIKKGNPFYKQSEVKTMWNLTANLFQEKYCDFHIPIDPFDDVKFESARGP